MPTLKHNVQSVYIPVIPDEEQDILAVINRYGAVYDTQIKTLLKIYKPEAVTKFNYCLDDIYRHNERMVFEESDEHGNRKIYPLSYYGNIPGPDIPECLWNVCKRIKDLDLNVVQLAEQPGCLFYPKAVVNIEENSEGETFEQASHEIVTDVYLNENNLWKVPYLQERYYARVSKREDGSAHGHTMINLVVNDMNIAEKALDTCAITIPMTVTFVDYNHPESNGMPRVTLHSVD